MTHPYTEKLEKLARELSKKCSVCKEHKPINDFHQKTVKSGKIYYHSRCNVCARSRPDNAQKKWKTTNRIKLLAQYRLRYAVRHNKISKPKFCQLCRLNNSKILGHHFDYTRPLDIIWVCHPCHSLVHRYEALIKKWRSE